LCHGCRGYGRSWGRKVTGREGRTPTVKYADYGNDDFIMITIIAIIITVPVI